MRYVCVFVSKWYVFVLVCGEIMVCVVMLRMWVTGHGVGVAVMVVWFSVVTIIFQSSGNVSRILGQRPPPDRLSDLPSALPSLLPPKK